MKNNLRFIFPRLVGATVIVGMASFIMFTLFKLLVGIVVIGGVVLLMKRLAGRNHPGLGEGRYGQFANGGLNPLPHRNQWDNPMTVNAYPSQKQTIVPIN